jgi:hypothetical protein
MTDADHGRPLPQTAEQWRLLQTRNCSSYSAGLTGALLGRWRSSRRG